jgi:hypothetical protein
MFTRSPSDQLGLMEAFGTIVTNNFGIPSLHPSPVNRMRAADHHWRSVEKDLWQSGHKWTIWNRHDVPRHHREWADPLAAYGSSATRRSLSSRNSNRAQSCRNNLPRKEFEPQEKNLTDELPKAALSGPGCSGCQNWTERLTWRNGVRSHSGPHCDDRVGTNDITAWQRQHGHLPRWTDAVI